MFLKDTVVDLTDFESSESILELPQIHEDAVKRQMLTDIESQIDPQLSAQCHLYITQAKQAINLSYLFRNTLLRVIHLIQSREFPIDQLIQMVESELSDSISKIAFWFTNLIESIDPLEQAANISESFSWQCSTWCELYKLHTNELKRQFKQDQFNRLYEAAIDQNFSETQAIDLIEKCRNHVYSKRWQKRFIREGFESAEEWRLEQLKPKANPLSAFQPLIDEAELKLETFIRTEINKVCKTLTLIHPSSMPHILRLTSTLKDWRSEITSCCETIHSSLYTLIESVYQLNEPLIVSESQRAQWFQTLTHIACGVTGFGPYDSAHNLVNEPHPSTVQMHMSPIRHESIITQELLDDLDNVIDYDKLRELDDSDLFALPLPPPPTRVTV